MIQIIIDLSHLLQTVVPYVMEHIINSEMLNFFLSKNLITKQQHGLIQKRTTCTNLLESIHDWTLNLQARRNTDVIYFDFKMAFDSVSHSKLLIKLSAYGLSGNLLAWLAEFLHNRSQIVKLNSSFHIEYILCMS